MMIYTSHLTSTIFLRISLQDLGSACGSKRHTVIVMIKPHEDYQDAYDECYNAVKDLPLPL